MSIFVPSQLEDQLYEQMTETTNNWKGYTSRKQVLIGIN